MNECVCRLFQRITSFINSKHRHFFVVAHLVLRSCWFLHFVRSRFLRRYLQLIIDTPFTGHGSCLCLDIRFLLFGTYWPPQGYSSTLRDDLYVVRIGRKRFIIVNGQPDFLCNFTVFGRHPLVSRGRSALFVTLIRFGVVRCRLLRRRQSARWLCWNQCQGECEQGKCSSGSRASEDTALPVRQINRTPPRRSGIFFVHRIPPTETYDNL